MLDSDYSGFVGSQDYQNPTETGEAMVKTGESVGIYSMFGVTLLWTSWITRMER